ncbi:MAG: hypothetical protein KAU21_08530 [Gammaproteobacteria bacterium]|nr:hypothetical protein [Gammaproteobacteria bacterium]
MHVWADLIYRIPSTDIESISYATDTQNTYSEKVGASNMDLIDFDSFETGSQNTPEPPLASFRLQDHRRMRSKELHYIDHPLFGIIVKAMPYELPELPVEELPVEETLLPDKKLLEEKSPGDMKNIKKTTPELKTGKIKNTTKLY